MIDRAALDDAVTWTNGRLRAHGGGIELADVTAGGEVTVRFTGMCCGCPWKPLTWLGTVEGALSAVPGVTAVAAAGTRISAESAERWQTLVRGSTAPRGGG